MCGTWGLYGNVSGVGEVQELFWDDRATVHVEMGGKSGLRPREILAKDKGKEKVVESDTLKKKKLQEQIDAQVVKEIEEEIARHNQRMNEQIAKDVKIARIHAEEELKMMINGLDRNNEVIARHLQEYEQSKAELNIREKIDLINEMKLYWMENQTFQRMRKSKEERAEVRTGECLKDEDLLRDSLRGQERLLEDHQARREHNSLPVLCRHAKQLDREDLQQL
nr:hypothetical protein [Tanacetum cinerariifolium]